MSSRYELLSRETLFEREGVFGFVSVKTTHEDGREHVTTEPVWDDRDSIGLLPVDYQAQTVLLVKQLRAAVFVRDAHVIVEACAGGIETSDASVESACRREAEEELGVQLDDLELVGTPYINPARMTETAYLFLATYVSGSQNPDDRSQDIDEDIEVVEVPIETLMSWYKAGAIRCPRLMILTQALMLRR